LMYLRYEHQHSTAGIRITAAAAAVIGWLPRRWGRRVSALPDSDR
jgi:hypothetical protein